MYALLLWVFMLQNTFIHVPGVSASFERRIWGCGIRSWSDFTNKHHRLSCSRLKKQRILDAIEVSQDRLSCGDFGYFAEALPSKEHWRVYPEFRERVAFVDIETTGLGVNNDITLIGLYDGKKTDSYILGKNLADFTQAIQDYDMIVTYNGACFDLPFILSKFPGLHLPEVHIDLRWVLRRIGLSGGLKSIEHQLGLVRSQQTQGLTGWDAVRLWHQYLRGDAHALDLLCEYNQEDIVNLKTILETTYGRIVHRTMHPVPSPSRNCGS